MRQGWRSEVGGQDIGVAWGLGYTGFKGDRSPGLGQTSGLNLDVSSLIPFLLSPKSSLRAGLPQGCPSLFYRALVCWWTVLKQSPRELSRP